MALTNWRLWAFVAEGPSPERDTLVYVLHAISINAAYLLSERGVHGAVGDSVPIQDRLNYGEVEILTSATPGCSGVCS
jgi:hypothetical protein